MPKKTVKKKTKKSKKTEKKEAIEPAQKVEQPPQKEKYFEAEGRRKTAVARIRLFTQGEKLFLVNEKPLEEYFPIFELRQIAQASLKKVNCLDKFRVSVQVRGGGLRGQAEATRQGIAKALVLFNPNFRKKLKKAGFLRRDPRMRERKKFGLKRARRAPQWQKR